MINESIVYMAFVQYISKDVLKGIFDRCPRVNLTTHMGPFKKYSPVANCTGKEGWGGKCVRIDKRGTLIKWIRWKMVKND